MSISEQTTIADKILWSTDDLLCYRLDRGTDDVRILSGWGI